MSNSTLQLGKSSAAGERQAELSDRTLPAWLVVFLRELSELWIWGKALTLIILYSVYLGISSYIFAANSELSLIPPKEMVFLTVSGAITVGLFVALIIGADSFSGERERSTLEALLLTPTKRKHIVFGKFLASTSPWPVAMLITIPYVVVLSQGDAILGTALFWGAIVGSLLSPAFTGFGMLTSIWSSSNRTSLFASLTAYLLFLLPVQFPGNAQTGTFGRLLKKVNPLSGADHFLEKLIVNNRTVAEQLPFLWAAIIFALLVFGLLFFFAAPRLSLDGGLPIKLRRRRIPGAVTTILLLGMLAWTGTRSAGALPSTQAESPSLQITIDKTSAITKNGDTVEFHTTVTNTGSETSPPLIVAMNIINLSATGDVVDPEDWSPERTQYLEAIGPGDSVTQSWILHTIIEGDYLVYVVLIPTPGSAEATSHPVTSPGIHVSVEAFARINPGGILPFALGIPVLLVVVLAALARYRRNAAEPNTAMQSN